MRQIREVARVLADTKLPTESLASELTQIYWPETFTATKVPNLQSQAFVVSHSTSYYAGAKAHNIAGTTPFGKELAIWSLRFDALDPFQVYDNTQTHAINLFPGYTVTPLINPAPVFNHDYLPAIANVFQAQPDIHTLFVNAQGEDYSILVGAYGPTALEKINAYVLASNYRDDFGVDSFGPRYASVINGSSSTAFWGTISPYVGLVVHWTRALAFYANPGDQRGILMLNSSHGTTGAATGYAFYENDPADPSDDVLQSWLLESAFHATFLAAQGGESSLDTYDLDLLADYTTRGDSLAYVLNPNAVYLDHVLANWSDQRDLSATNYSFFLNDAWTHVNGSRLVSWRPFTRNERLDAFPRVVDIAPKVSATPADVWGSLGELHDNLTIQFSSLVRADPVHFEALLPGQTPSSVPDRITVSVPAACGSAGDMQAVWNGQNSTPPTFEIGSPAAAYDSQLSLEFTNDSEFVYYWRYSHNFGLDPAVNYRPACVQETDIAAVNLLESMKTESNDFLQDVQNANLPRITITIPETAAIAPNGIGLHGTGENLPLAQMHSFTTQWNLGTNAKCVHHKYREFVADSAAMFRVTIPCVGPSSGPVFVSDTDELVGRGSSQPIMTAGNRVFFQNKFHLYTMDTAGNIDRILDSNNSAISYWEAWEGELYFHRSSRLYRTNGGNPVSEMSMPLLPGTSSTVPDPKDFTVGDDGLYFRYDAKFPGPFGLVEGIAKVHPGGAISHVWDPIVGDRKAVGAIAPPVGSGSSLFFDVIQRNFGREVSSPGGVIDIWPGEDSGRPSAPLLSPASPLLRAAPDRVLFLANDGTNGQELWWAGGGNFGRITDLANGSDTSAIRLNYRGLVPGTTASYRLFFVHAPDNESDILYRASDTGAPVVFIGKHRSPLHVQGVVTVSPVSPNTAPSHRVLFSENNTLYFTDTEIIDIDQVTFGGAPRGFVDGSNGYYYFIVRADSPSLDSSLWRTDGTREGTSPVKTIWPEYNSAELSTRLYKLEGQTIVFFAKERSGHTWDLWKLPL